MSRSIFERGAAWPVGIQATKTFDTNFTFDSLKPQDGIDWRQYPHQCFPWLASASETDVNLNNDRQFLMTFPDANGDEVPVRITPAVPQLQTSINNEMSSIVWRQDWDTYGLPDLARIKQEDGVDYLSLEAHLTPSNQADNFTTQRDSFKVIAINETAKTVTLEGSRYYRKRVTSTRDSNGVPFYAIGEHWGMQHYMRDQLTTDKFRALDEFKVREYDYAFMNHRGTQYRYTEVKSIPERDRMTINWGQLLSFVNDDFEEFSVNPDNSVATIRYVEGAPTSATSVDLSLLELKNQNLLDDLIALSDDERRNPFTVRVKIQDARNAEVPSSEHVLSMPIMPANIAVGDTMTIIRRLPYVTTMLATLGTFSQLGGYWDFRLRFDRKKRQFSALFLWPNYLETQIRRFIQQLKEMEIDVKEFPGATTPFMNTHRPQANRNPADSMLDYARVNGLDPVMSHPEWTETNKQQHQLLIPIDHPDYVDSGAWHDVRVCVCLEGNPLGFPANSIAWYERTADGLYKFTGGCLLSPEAVSGALDHLQMFFCNPVDGDFVADMELFAPGLAAESEELPITFDVAYARCYQFAGFEAGGAGLPNAQGVYPNGLTPSPNDEIVDGGSGGSGGGVVPAVPVTPLPGVPQGGQVIVKDYTQIGTRCDGGKLLEAEIE